MNTSDANDRLALRHDVLMHARCRKSPWRIFDVELGNISAGGCSILDSREPFAVGEVLSLRIAHLKPVEGHVSWVGDGAVGVEFRRALPPGVIRVLEAAYSLRVVQGQARPAGT
ncbi:PilZ domain-containing protein [Novosphingobium profundi]|uniref:PilZ domain-containing protein n=1 Tax=Novosphingobium profundi TaxID=1774954 RepID=UPI001BDAAFEF|nr:PilZ domain-containing protein [Novosphingobium profundi]MBT0669032.1 PilZ domain-containing protein [Novosphingobium profundi]